MSSNSSSIQEEEEKTTTTAEEDATANNSRVTIRLIQVTDVYTLENFPSLSTLIAEKRKENLVYGPTVSMLTGDFLAPYLLASLDKGRGMISMLNAVPIDVVTWGNHDINDCAHEDVLARAAEYHGTIVNSNMTDHASYKLGLGNSVDHLVIQAGQNQHHIRRVALLGIITSSLNCYGHLVRVPEDVCIDDPWDTINAMLTKLQGDKVDLVVPLCHLYESQDNKTCELFDLPLVLSGHDHHVVDRLHCGTRLLKAGSDAIHAVIVDLTWDNCTVPGNQPRITYDIVNVKEWEPDPVIQKKMEQATAVLTHLNHTQLCAIPDSFRPLISAHRDQRCSMGTFLTTTLLAALNKQRHAGPHGGEAIDACIIPGGSIRGAGTHPPNSYFSMRDLKSEFETRTIVGCVHVKGQVLQAAVKSTRNIPNPNMFQCDKDVVEDSITGLVTHIGGSAIDLDRMYCIATTVDFWNGCEVLLEYFKLYPEQTYTGEEAFGTIYSVLVSYFAGNVWAQLLHVLDHDGDSHISTDEFKKVDSNDDGSIDVKEMLQIMAMKGGFEVDAAELEFALQVMRNAGDRNNDGKLTLDELNSAVAAHP